jgi:hypothetical protein
MRTLRSLAFLTAASAVVLLAAYLPTPLVPWVQSVAVASIALVLLFWNRPFRALRKEEEEFIQTLDDVNTQLNAAATKFEQDPAPDGGRCCSPSKVKACGQGGLDHHEPTYTPAGRGACANRRGRPH